MKKLLGVVAGLLLVVPCVAQNRVGIAGLLNAWDFAYGINGNTPPLVVVGGGSTAGGTYSVTVTNNGVVVLPDGSQVSVLSTSVPIQIGAAGNVETVTPSAVSCNQQDPQYGLVCFVTATYTNAHGQGDRITSSTNGLQEAALKAVANGGGLVALSPTWWKQYSSHSAGVTALTGYKSLATTTYSVLDYSGVAGAVSYAASSGSNYASTTHVIY